MLSDTSQVVKGASSENRPVYLHPFAAVSRACEGEGLAAEAVVTVVEGGHRSGPQIPLPCAA